MKSMPLDEVMSYLLRDYGGSIRAMSRATGVSPSYLSRMRHGIQHHPSPTILKKIGLKEHNFYTIKSWEPKP